MLTYGSATIADNWASYQPVKQQTNHKPSLNSPDLSGVLRGSKDVAAANSACTLPLRHTWLLIFCWITAKNLLTADAALVKVICRQAKHPGDDYFLVFNSPELIPLQKKKNPRKIPSLNTVVGLVSPKIIILVLIITIIINNNITLISDFQDKKLWYIFSSNLFQVKFCSVWSFYPFVDLSGVGITGAN